MVACVSETSVHGSQAGLSKDKRNDGSEFWDLVPLFQPLDISTRLSRHVWSDSRLS